MKTVTKYAILILGLMFLSAVNADILLDIDEATANKNWNKADKLLLQLSTQYKQPQILFRIQASRAWIAAQSGDWEKSKSLLELSRNSYVVKTNEDVAALNDTELAIQLGKVKGIPPLHERIVIWNANDQFVAQLDKKNGDLYDVVNAKVSALLKSYVAVEKAMTPFSVPVPPKLDKGEFERTNDFLARVKLAESEYKKRVDIIKHEYQQRIDQKQKELNIKSQQLPEMRRFYTQWIMNAAFGKPKISDLEYDADLEIYRATVIVKSKFGETLKHNVGIEIPFDKAENIKPKLLKASPMLVYKINDQGMLLTHIFMLTPERKLYAAELTNDFGEQRHQSYQVAGIDMIDVMEETSIAMSSMVDGLSVSVTSVSVDPEIRKLKEKLKNAKIRTLEKARKTKIIAKLQKELDKYTATAKKQYFDDLEALIASRKPVQPNPNKYAVVIGIEKYESTAEVAFANRSAQTFTKLAKKILGVPANNIYTLTDKSATAGNISVRIKDYASRIPKDGTLYFYYAGHGIPAQVKGKAGLPYILPYDIAPQFIHLKDDFMLSNIWKQLTANNKGRVVAFMDSCFSGNADNNLVFEGVAPGLMRRVDATLPNNKILIYTAGNSHQFANYYPEKGHRLFSYYLFKGLMEGKQTTALSLQDYIQEKVSSRSLKMGPAYEQTPEIKGNFKENIM